MLKIAFLTGSLGLLLGSASPPPMRPLPVQQAPLPLAEPLPGPLHAEPVQTEPVQAVQIAEPPSLPPAPAVPQIAPEPAPPPVEPPATSGVRIVVSLPLQRAYVFDEGELLWSAPVSTGKRGHATPVGTFPILQKKVHHRSSKYDNAPMPYMQRLTWSGIALHAGRVPGYPASHGCIRLPRSYAKKLYALTDHGTRVTITREKPPTAEDALELI